MEPRRQIGGYDLDDKLGEGGMGTVWRARHPAAPGRAVALKILTGGAPADSKALERFRREVAALAALAHPHIVRILGGSLEGPQPFYVMELVAGPALDDLIARGALDARRAARIARGVADAIAHAHAHGVLHRDLKPANILLDEEERPRVCDFGVARLASADRLTRTGTFVGSLGYAAPEQLGGDARQIDARADVFALGGILWALLAGRGPFDESIAKAGRRVVGVSAGPPSLVAPGVPAALDAICSHALEEEAAKRYATAAALRDDLDRFLRGERPSVEVVPAWRRATRGAFARPLVRVALLLVAAGLLVLGAVVGFERIARPGAEGIARVASADLAQQLEEKLALAAKPLKPGEAVLALQAAAEAALAAPDRVSLVGERPGFALGAALLEGSDALVEQSGPILPATVAADAADLLRLAEALAAARLGVAPGDPAGRVLRAHVALARAGAPRLALGPGVLGVPAAVAPAVLDDLRGASSAPGPLGAAAAWLVADLLVGAGPSREADAREAVAAAAARDPDGAARAPLEHVLRVPATHAGYLELARPVTAGGERGRIAALELSRFFARLGAPGVVDVPEVASDPRALGRALAREPIQPYFPLVPRPGGVIRHDTAVRLRQRLTPSPTKATKAEVAGELRALLEGDPTDVSVLTACADKGRALLTRPVFKLLASVYSPPSIYDLAADFDRGYRAGRSTMANMGLDDRWETGAGLAGCEEFDRRLAEDVAWDVALAFLRTRTEPVVFERALTSTRALRRLEELEADPPTDETEHARIAFFALLGLEELERLGHGQALILRARLRGVALPAPLGAALGRLDIARAARYWRSFAQNVRGPIGTGDLTSLTFHAASVAALLHAPDEERDLFELGGLLGHETAVRYALVNRDVPRRLSTLLETLEERNAALSIAPLYRGLSGWTHDPKRARVLQPTAEDRARVLKGDVFRYPPVTVHVAPRIEPLDARITAIRVPSSIAPRAPLRIVVEALNTGVLPWTAEVRLCVWCCPQGSDVRVFSEDPTPEGAWIPRDRTVPPGARFTFEVAVSAPATVGDYVVEAEMDHWEGFARFGERAKATLSVR